jgi:hypothetical protein
VSRYLHRQLPYTPSVRATYGGPPIDVPRNLPGVRLEQSQPGALGPEQGVWVRLPGADFPPAGATAVDEVGDANIAPGVSATLVTVQIPDTQRLRIAGIGFGADDETALGFLTWSLRLNGDTQPGYTGKPAAIGSIRQLADVFFLAGSSATMTIVAASAASAVVTYRFICRVRGWFYTETLGGK